MSQDMLKGGKKDNSRRKYQGGGRRPDKRAARKLQEEVRLEVWNEKTPLQKLQALDLRLGDGVGAKRQRAKLLALTQAQIAEKTETLLQEDTSKKKEKNAAKTSR